VLDLEGLHIRAALFRCVREYFFTRGFLEVDTPLRQPVLIPERYIVPIAAEGQYLHTSPELCMKRLLAAGCRDIFQICPCFRKNERGRRHLEEFAMLEWYRSGADYRHLMLDCEDLLQYLIEALPEPHSSRSADKSRAAMARSLLRVPAARLTVEEAFSRFAPMSLARALAEERFDEVLTEHVEPCLGTDGPLFLLDYPRELASLAKVDPARPFVAERFELYLSGIELANGFSELTDSAEQRQRFEQEIETIGRLQQREQVMPERFLEDLDRLEGAAGIAFGLDRLLMLLLGKTDINEVVTFSPGDFF